jgi:hypothetical protein
LTTRQTKIEVTGGTSKYERAMRNTERITKRTTSSISSMWLKAAGTIYGAIKAWDLAKFGARAEQEMNSFRNMAASYGANADQILADLKRLSGGTVDTMTLVQKAGTAMMMGIAPDKVSRLMEIARATSKMTGQTVTKAFEDISLAVGRQSRMILDNLGIIIKVGEANEMYAKQLGKTAEQLTDVEKKQAFLNAALVSGEEMMQRLGEQTKTAAEWFQSAEALGGNLKVMIGQGLVQAAKSLAITFVFLYKTANEMIGGVISIYDKFLSLIERLPGPHRDNVRALREDVQGIASGFKSAADEADRFINSLLTMQSGGATTAPNMGFGGGEGGGEGGGGLGKDIVKMVENETMKFQVALVARSQMEIFMDSEKYAALQEMEQSHREWEMEQLTSSAEYKQTMLQSEHDAALAMVSSKTQQEVTLELQRIKTLESLDKQSANARMSIARGLGIGLLNVVGLSNEAIFMTTQAFDAAMAIISGYSAGAQALALFGPILGPPVMTKMIALGYLQAGAIMATAIGQAAASGNTGATGAGSYVSPVVTTPVSAPATVSEPQQQETKPALTIYVDTLYGSEEYVQHLAELITEGVENYDVRLVASRAQRLQD